MPTIRHVAASIAALAVVALIALAPAQSQPPPWAPGAEKAKGHGKGHGKGEGHAKGHAKGHGKGKGKGHYDPYYGHFTQQHAVIVHEYYDHRFRSGWCPPGLAKKRNGCMPPGQAKKWQMGRPLPRGVVYYDLPPDLVVRLGAPPSGYRYARVDADILMLAVGTGLVVAAIHNLGAR